MTQHENASIAWPLALSAAAVGGTLATACMMPFVAIATLAAATTTVRNGLTAVLGVWVLNQLLGFGLLGYPQTGYAFAWGGALGAASVAVFFVARRIVSNAGWSALRLVAAFATGFVAFEALLYAFALVAGGTGTFKPAILLLILRNDAIWLVGLAALHLMLTRAAPRLFGLAPVLRLS